MDSLPLVLGGGLLATAVVLFVLLPVIRGRSALMERTEEDVSEEEHNRETSLRALRDLEYDRFTGKVDEEDYRRLKAELAREALAALDAAEPGQGAAASEAPREPASHRETEEAVEAEIARIRRGLQDGRTCRVCAHVNRPEARYCAQCGRSLERGEPERVGAGSDGG